MFEVIKKYRRPLVILVITFLAILAVVVLNNRITDSYSLGSRLHTTSFIEENILQTSAFSGQQQDLSERFQRPSKQPALDTKFRFQDLYGSPLPRFDNPEDVLKAYFAILKEASNMIEHHGGCGSIGMGTEPYPYAYSLLTEETRKNTTQEQFADSFKGIGHMTLLKLLPAYTPKDTPAGRQYYFIEFEAITGTPVTESNKNTPQPSAFIYYYGLATVDYTQKEGWKIQRMDIIPEDFLCAPYHSWFYEAQAVVEIVYKEWYKLIDRIDRIETKNEIVRIYASGNGKEYRFDFVQITNGHQVMLHENIKVGGVFQETNILKPDDQVFKLSIINPIFQ
jgi:hypothetical protein